MKLYVRMRGGLGNQMFQYAYALALRERYPDAGIILDTREYDTYKLRSFGLTDFVLADDTTVFQKGKLAYDLWIKAYHVYQRAYREIRHEQPYGLFEPFAKRGMIVTGLGCPLPRCSLPETVYLYGYFQNAELLLTVRPLLQQAYSLPSAEAMKLPESLRNVGDNAAALSIPLYNDVIAKSGWHYCTREFYRAGLDLIRKDHPLEKIVVFSDSPEKIAEAKWFDDMGLEIEYTSGLSPSQQMEILKRFRYYVIANSTFAWWGAFLGAGEDGVIVAPTIWQGNRPTEKDPLHLKNMILLPNGT